MPDLVNHQRENLPSYRKCKLVTVQYSVLGLVKVEMISKFRMDLLTQEAQQVVDEQQPCFLPFLLPFCNAVDFIDATNFSGYLMVCDNNEASIGAPERPQLIPKM